jgi:hypothetical protein
VALVASTECLWPRSRGPFGPVLRNTPGVILSPANLKGCLRWDLRTAVKARHDLHARDRDLGRLEATMARLDAEAAAVVVRP